MNIVTRKISELTPHPDNPRKHPQEQLAVLIDSLRIHGQQKNIVVTPDNVILAGHGLVAAAKLAGLPELFCQVYDGPYPEAFIALDNRTSDLSSNDDTLLAKLLEELRDADVPFEAIGFTEQDINALLKQAARADKTLTGDGEDAPEPEDVQHICQVNDIWQIGEHRLACGDCRDPELVSRLFGDDKCRMVWTDPPYGIAYVGKTKKALTIDNDAMSEVDTQALAADALKLAVAHGVIGAACYVACPAGTLLPYFIAAVSESGFTYKHSFVWVKNQFVMGRCDYHYRHEQILYGRIENGAHYFVDDHTKDSVFEIDRPKRSEEHPTMKPVALPLQHISNSSLPGESVYDPFCGSGTTMIACERSGRVARACELAPVYADVIRARMVAENPAITPVLLSRNGVPVGA